MNKYLEAEKRLAELSGFTQIRFAHADATSLVGIYPNREALRLLPRWTRDNAAAFALMVEHECYPCENGTGSIVIPGKMWSGCRYSTIIIQHPDKETAVRYAIVMAVINKLETNT